MDKVFISVPMSGSSNDDILKAVKNMKKIAEIAFGKRLSPVYCLTQTGDDDILTSKDLCNRFAASLDLMKDCEYFIGVRMTWASGCNFEEGVARRIGLKTVMLNIPDWDFLEYAKRRDHMPHFESAYDEDDDE